MEFPPCPVMLWFEKPGYRRTSGPGFGFGGIETERDQRIDVASPSGGCPWCPRTQSRSAVPGQFALHREIILPRVVGLGIPLHPRHSESLTLVGNGMNLGS